MTGSPRFAALPVVTPIGERWACPCCDFLTLTTAGCYDSCPVCGWEDCPAQCDQPEDSNGPNNVSLNEARETFRRHGRSKLTLPDRPRRIAMPAEYPPGVPVPAIATYGAYAGTSVAHEFEGPGVVSFVVPVDRVATLADGRRIEAVRPTPTHAWTVQFEHDPDSAYTGAWLLSALRKVLGLADDDWPRELFALVDELAGFDTPLGLRFACPCCDLLTLTGAAPGTFSRCPVCGWEDDLDQGLHPDDPNAWRLPQPSLREARANVRAGGSADGEGRRRFSRREPLPEEQPPKRTGAAPKLPKPWWHIERAAILPDGRAISATQAAPMDRWLVQLQGTTRRFWLPRLGWALRSAIKMKDADAEPWFDDLVDQLSAYDTPLGRRVRCLCCDFLTVDRARDERRCPVCGWVDDLDRQPTLQDRAGADDRPLRAARTFFAAHRVANEAELGRVRPPLPEEFPPGRPETGPPYVRPAFSPR